MNQESKLSAREKLDQAHKEWKEATKAYDLSPNPSIDLTIRLRETTLAYEAALNEFYLTWSE